MSAPARTRPGRPRHRPAAGSPADTAPDRAVRPARVTDSPPGPSRTPRRCAAGYPDLFPGRPFDPAFFSTITLANAFCAPWLSAERLRITNRITLWVFGLDRLVDHVTTDPAEIDDIVRRCLATARGETASDDPLSGFLAEIRADLAAAPSFPALRDVWYDEMRRMLTAMA